MSDLAKSLNLSHKFFKNLLDELSLFIKLPKYKQNHSYLNFVISEIVLSYIYPIINSKQYSFKQNLFFRIKSLIKFFLINRKFLNKKKYIIENDSIVLLCFTLYIFNDSLKELVSPLLKSRKEDILIIYDESEISNTEISNALKISDIRLKIISIQKFYDKDQDNNYKKEKRKIRLWSKKIKKLKSKNSNLIKQIFGIYFVNLLKQRLKFVHASENLLSQNKIKTIISSDTSDSRCRIIVGLSNSFNIKSLEVQYGAYSNEAIEFKYFISDLIFVWGKKHKDLMINFGIEPQRIIVTGPLRLDFYQNLFSKPINKSVLYIPTHSMPPSVPKIVNKMNLWFNKLVKNNPDFNFIAKPHPLDKFNSIEKSRNLRILDSKEDLRKYVFNCDYVITCGSTLTLDAIILNKKVIMLNPTGWESFSYEVWKNFPISFVSKFEDLNNLLLLNYDPPKNSVNELIFYKKNELVSKKIMCQI